MSTRTEPLGSLLESRYQITGAIARGGMSTVYRGIDTRLDRPVAIKVMDPVFADNPEFLSRFAMEARAIARLSHPGLVSVFDQGRDGEIVYLVMELVDGGTVRALLTERGPMPPAHALSLLEPVLAALATAHRAGLVHRDIKPENVLISRDGAVKVADFGLVRALSATPRTPAAPTSVTEGNTILGTVAYLAPEQVSHGDAGPRSDVYSAGVLLYELLTGAPPYTGGTALEVAYRHVTDDVPAPGLTVPGIPRELDELVRGATRREPGRRYRDAGHFLEEVLDVRRRLGLRRLRVPAPHPVPRTAQQRRDPVAPTRMLTALTPRRAPGPAPVSSTRALRALRRRSALALTAWATAVVLLATAVGVGAWWLGSGRFTTVPRLAGMSVEQAEQVLTEADLASTLDNRYDDTAAPRTVIGAEPGDGARVERGTRVVLAVSLGRPTVPDLAPGTAAAVAEQELKDAGLTATQGPGRYDDEVSQGSLLTLDPPAGTALEVGAPVAVSLSLGPAPVDVPDVTGRSADEAAGVLDGVGLTVGTTTTEFSADVAGGDVITTSPAPGVLSSRGTAVELVVSTALTVPDVTGRRPGDAARTLADAGFTVAEGGSGTSGRAGAKARVTGTDPGAGSLVDPADARVDVLVQEKVAVPRVQGSSVDEARAALEGLGLEVDVRQLLPLGGARVRGQDPTPGTEVDPGTTITITAFL